MAQNANTGLNINGVNTFVSIPNDPSLNFTTGMTIEVWFKYRGGTPINPTLVAKEVSSSILGWNLHYSGYSVVYSLAVANTSGVTYTIPSGASAIYGWNHIVATNDGTDLKIYWNGSLVQTALNKGFISNTTGTMQLGARHSNSGGTPNTDFANGTLREVRYYNDKVLTASEVLSNYNGNITAGYTGQWLFNEGAGVMVNDSSGYGNHGVINGGLEWSGKKPVVSGISTDGTGYVNVPDSASLNFTTGMTIECWYRANKINNALNNALIAKENSGTPNGWTLFLTTGGLPSYAKGSVASQVTVTGITSVTTRQWTHIVATNDGTTVKIYINGTLNITSATSGFISNSTGSLYFGSRHGNTGTGNTDWSCGSFREVRFYKDQVLTATEVLNNCNGNITPGYTGQWLFNENTGTIANDTSGSGNHGTLNGGISWATPKPFLPHIEFNGVSDYVTIGRPSILTSSLSQVTLEAWVNIASLKNTSVPFGLSNAYRFTIYSNTGNSEFVVQTANNAWYGNGTFAQATGAGGAVPIGQWYHLVGTYDGTTTRLYVNGVLKASGSQAISGALANGAGTNNFFIGATDGPASYFAGSIAVTRVFNRALSATEITSQYGAGIGQGTIRDSSLIGEWCTDGTVNDTSGNNNNGTVAGTNQSIKPPASPCLLMDGIDDAFMVPPLTYDEVIMDLEVISHAANCKYIQGSHIGYIQRSGTNVDQWVVGTPGWTQVYINGVSETNNTDFIPLGPRFTLRAVGTSTANTGATGIFASSTGISGFISGKLYSIKFYSSGTLVAYYDLAQSNTQDQSGNGNHATLNGNPIWLNSGGVKTALR